MLAGCRTKKFLLCNYIQSFDIAQYSIAETIEIYNLSFLTVKLDF